MYAYGRKVSLSMRVTRVYVCCMCVYIACVQVLCVCTDVRVCMTVCERVYTEYNSVQDCSCSGICGDGIEVCVWLCR